VPDALAQGADTLVSIGGVQSNHTRQVAAVAARLGLKAVLVQESWVDWPDPLNDRVGNILLSRIMGADVRLVEAEFGIGVKSSWEQALDDVRAAGGPRTPSRPGPRTTGWAAWASRTGRTKSSSRKATWGFSSTPSWCAALPGRLRRG
jgi:1-aminocyclopropane-1-carboxylate deaminase